MSVEENDKARKFIISMLTTLAVGIFGKFVALLLSSDSVTNAMDFLLESFPSIAGIFVASISAGFFGISWNKKSGE